MLLNLYDMFVKKDALLVEINPYAEDSNDSRKFFNPFFKDFGRSFFGVFIKNLKILPMSFLNFEFDFASLESR